MKLITVIVDATLGFDLYAESEADAIVEAQRLLSSEAVASKGVLNPAFPDAYIAPAGIDCGFPSMEAEEV